MMVNHSCLRWSKIVVFKIPITRNKNEEAEDPTQQNLKVLLQRMKEKTTTRSNNEQQTPGKQKQKQRLDALETQDKQQQEQDKSVNNNKTLLKK